MGEPEKKADASVSEGLDFYQQGKLDDALGCWQKALELDPGHPRAQQYLDYVSANLKALEQRFNLVKTQLFGGSKEESKELIGEVPSKLDIPLQPAVGDDPVEDQEPTVSMPVKALYQGIQQSREEHFQADNDYLELMDGGGEENVDDFEPMEKTPVGVGIPDPVRLVATDGEEHDTDDQQFEWDEETPSIREVGQQGLPAQAGLRTDELELDDDDIIEKQSADLGVKVKYRSLAEFDAAYGDEYAADSDLEIGHHSPEPEPAEMARDPHKRETRRLTIEGAESSDPEQDEHLVQRRSDEDDLSELEAEFGQGRHPSDEYMDLTPQPEVNVSYNGAEGQGPPGSSGDFKSLEINFDESIDVEPDEVQFGGAMDFDAEQDSEDLTGGAESGSESSDGLVWEEGTVSWDEEQHGELEVMVFERDEPTPEPVDEPLEDPLMVMATTQDSFNLGEADDEYEDPFAGTLSEEPLAWSPTEETPDSPPDYPDVGFAVQMEPEITQPEQPPAPEVEAHSDEVTLQRARQLMKGGELKEALEVCEKVCEAEPDNTAARRFLERIQQTLLKRYWAELGDLSRVPTVKVPRHEIIWQEMDHRTGFLLSRIDGILTYEEILDICGMPEFEGCQTLVSLKKSGVIG